MTNYSMGEEVMVLISLYGPYAVLCPGDIITLKGYNTLTNDWYAQRSTDLTTWIVPEAHFTKLPQLTDGLTSWTNAYGDTASPPTSLPEVATPAPVPIHSCDNNRKTYDSGWSRYDYCGICDKKIVDSA